MSGSSLDGLDIAFAEFHETAGKWKYELIHSVTYPYSPEWRDKLRNANKLSALEYQLLHTSYGHYLGQQVNRFINENKLDFKVQLIASHGHTVFHMPSRQMTAQIGDGAAIAAETGINVVSDLRSMDIALGGHGAPIVPIGERHLLGDNKLFLNIGGIANISVNHDSYIAFDICPANRVMNLLAKARDLEFDRNGDLARSGTIHQNLLKMLNDLEYYKKPYPKSLDNSFGIETVYPMIKGAAKPEDLLATFVEHIAIQVAEALRSFALSGENLMITGGGAHNSYLVERIRTHVEPLGINIVLPSADLIEMKEAIIMAFIGILRWREEFNVMASVTGAKRDSIGGAVYLG
jgi:anhydro-N-acetylmuramic acid kinase